MKPPEEHEGALLAGVKVLMMASGHHLTDPRIHKQALSLQKLGATMTLVGRLDRKLAGPIRALPIKGTSSRLTRFLWQPWRCVWAARREAADIIHVHDAEMLITLPLARLWWWRSKFVYDVREDFANLMMIRDWLPRWSKPAVRVVTDLMERTLASFADALVSVTPPLTAKFRNRNKAVAYNFVSREFFDRVRQSNRRAVDRQYDVVHLGTLSSKRARFLAETLRLFHQLRPGARSLVLGVSGEIERMIRGLLPGGCTLQGETPYEQIPLLLGNAKVGVDVHPWSDPHLDVALAVKVCEYMAAGCAVVASSMPVLDRILTEARPDSESITILHGGEPADYASALVRMVQAIEAGADPGANLRRMAERHMTWEGEARKIAQLYRQLLRKDR